MRKVLIVFLILLVGGAVVGDRLAASRAESEISKQVAAQYGLAQRPEVEISGFPLITQAISGTYKQIDVAIGDWTEQGVTVNDVRVKVTDLNAPLADVISGDRSAMVAGTAEASAIIPWAVIQDGAPKEVQKVSRSGENVLLEGRFQLPLIGVADTAVTVSLKPTPRGIQVTPISVKSGTAVIPIGAFAQTLSYVIPLTGLPMGSRITGVKTEDGGVRVTGEADNVPLNGAPLR